MISVIIPSRNKGTLNAISENIETTIGVPYEIISYDNTKDGFGICKIYNLCAEKAQYENFVFCHDDIVFHTNDWGEALIEVLADKRVGLVGVAGAIFKSKYPLSWTSIDTRYYRSNATFDYSTMSKKKESESLYEEVAVVDGMFLATTKTIWKKNTFNETELSGFHMYDIDYSYKLFKNYKIVVSNKIVVEHKSRGNFNLNWFDESVKWHIGKSLPIFTDGISANEALQLEKKNQENYVYSLVKFGYNIRSWPLELYLLCINNRKLYLGLLVQILKKTYNNAELRVKRLTAPYRKRIWFWIYRLRLSDNNLCIISNNCWGGDLYEAFNLQYNTPFVGLFINAPCYIKLLNNLDYYLSCDLVFTDVSKYDIKNINYPIGLLDDIEVHFLHYKSEEEARSKWDRRKSRMPKEKNQYLFKMDDRDFATSLLIEEFHKLPFKNTISFTKTNYLFTNNKKLKKEDDLILLHTTYDLVDIPTLINDKKVKNTFFNKVLSTLVPYPSKWL